MTAHPYAFKWDNLVNASRAVESILGVYAVPEGDSIMFFREIDDHTRAGKTSEAYEASRLLILLDITGRGSLYYMDACEPTLGDPPWTCEPAPWKAAVLDELRRHLTLNEYETKFFEHAIAVFRGEIIHPAVLASIR